MGSLQNTGDPTSGQSSLQADNAGDSEDDMFHAAFLAEIRKLRGDEEFEAAITFEGARAGFVFKLGRSGLGYYRDTASSAPVEAKPQQAEVREQSVSNKDSKIEDSGHGDEEDEDDRDETDEEDEEGEEKDGQSEE